jgi:transposase
LTAGRWDRVTGVLDCCFEHATQTLLACAVPLAGLPCRDSEAVRIMDTVIQRCAGLDIGKRDLKACVRIPGKAGRRVREIRTFATTTPGLLALQDWLASHEVTTVGMEATSDYWKPVYYLLEEAFEVQLLNARHMRNVPGRKTDVADSAWIAQLVEHGLVRPSFVPPPPIRRLRDLVRKQQVTRRDFW